MENRLDQKYIKWALLLGATAVMLGAFGAHYFAERLIQKSLNAYKTAVLYQFLHAILLLIISLNSHFFKTKYIRIFYRLIITGVLFFSGSIYLLSTKPLTELDFLSILGPITPIGGLLLIASWITLLLGVKKK